MLSGKNIARVDISRMERMFVSSHGPENPRAEHWYETSEWLEGFEFVVRRVRQTNGRLRFRDKHLGYKIEGRGEPLQNKIDDYQMYRSLLNGDMNLAFLCGDQLWLFGMRDLGGNEWKDDRISIITDLGYTSPMQKAFTEFAGHVMQYKIMQIKDLKLSNRKLTYKILKTTYSDAMLSDGADVIITN